MIKLFFWLIIISLIAAILVGGYGIWLYSQDISILRNTITTSYLIGAFTLLTPTLTKTFIIIITKVNYDNNQTPVFLVNFVKSWDCYKIETNNYYSDPSITTLSRCDQIEYAVFHEANMHIFAFFWQTLVLMGLTIYLATIIHIDYFFLIFIPLLTLIILIVWMAFKTENEYDKYFAPCNKELYGTPLKFISKNLPPLNSIITIGRFFILASNIIITIIIYLRKIG